MGIHAHHKVEPDQGQNQRECQDIESAPDGHSASYSFRITMVLFPGVVDIFTNFTHWLIWVKFQLQRIEQICKSQQVKDQKAEEIPPKQKRYVEPDLLAVKILMQPGENMGSADKKEQEEYE